MPRPVTTHEHGRPAAIGPAGTPTFSGANVIDNLFNPPAAGGLPLAALDSATEGANALDAWAADPHGRNFLAHALVQLARDGWLRPEAGEGFEPVRERDDVPEPQDPAVLPAVPVPPTTHAADQAAVYREAADDLAEAFGDPMAKHIGALGASYLRRRAREIDAEHAELRRMADEAQQPECTASLSGNCLREAESETACDTEAGECVHGGKPADEAQQQPDTETPTVAALQQHRNDTGCTVVLCVCGCFQYPVEEQQ